MNGPEHYRRAQALVRSCFHDVQFDDEGELVEVYTDDIDADDPDAEGIRNALKAAGVHATLALTAATIEAARGVRRSEWEAAGVLRVNP